MTLPPDFSQREVLHNEIHARPPVRLQSPEQVAYVALIVSPEERAREPEAIAALAQHAQVPVPETAAGHFIADFGAFRLKWERHTEFTAYTFYRRSEAEDDGPLAHVPAEWVAAMPGRTIVAARVSLVRGEADPDALAARFGTDMLIGSTVTERAASAFTDFCIGPDGYSRFVMIDDHFGPYQGGRIVQRLLEIETYRMMALLAFPLAREVGPKLTASEERLARVTERMSGGERADDAALLDELMAVAAEVERSVSASKFRFTAAQAYFDLVRQRVAELREGRIGTLQTIGDFMERRLAPAMNTCLAMSRRQDELSARIARTSQLLRTRVEIAHERQNQELLVSMNRRVRLQLRLQQTVEGLSVAAITYYVVGLLDRLANGARAAGLHVNPEITAGIAIPIVAFGVWVAVRRVRRALAKDQ